MRYSDILADVPGKVDTLTKIAQMDVQEEQLEQDFSKLAYMFVADRAAQLMRYLLGFEVVEHEPDGSKAIGVFGFKVGNDYYYIPAFFITNQVKGIDMIFSKKTNMFFPLSQEWVDNIIQRDSIELGNSVDAKMPRQDFDTPNFDFIRSPTVGGSYSAKTAEHYDEYEDGKSLMKAAWDSMCRTTVEKLATDKDMQAALAGFVGASKGKELSKKAEAGVLQQWLSERGGPGAVSSLFDSLCSSVKFANAALHVYPSIESMHVSRFASTANGCGVKRAEKELAVVDSTQTDTVTEDKKRLLVNGFYIDDKRDPQTLSKTYQYDHAASFGKPTEPGKYDVLTSDGVTQPMWVVRTAKVGSSGGDLIAVTDPLGSSKMRGVSSYGSDVYVKGDSKADTSGLYDNAIPLSEMATDHTYMLVNRDGDAVIPKFEVRSCTYTPGENMKVDGWVQSTHEPWDSTPGDFDIYRNDRYRDRHGHLQEGGSRGSSVQGITLTKNTGKAVKAGDRILVPSNYKAVLLEIPWPDRNGEQSPSVSLGDLTDLRFHMEKASCHSLKVVADGNEFYVKMDDMPYSRPYSYKQACMSLTGRLGMSVSDTEGILAKAAEEREAATNVMLGKAAQFVGVNMPQPAPQSPSMDPYSGVAMYSPYETETTGSMTGVPPVPHGNPYGENLGGEGETQQGSADISGAPGGDQGSAPIDQEAMDLASQAGELGQRHVFDYAAIGGLAKVYDTGALIDSYIPQFMQSIDRLGRVLFLYYWRNEDFGERYGSSDTVELEDSLRSVFKQFGNLALTLRQKTIDADGAVI